jgi:hypothetical protein
MRMSWAGHVACMVRIEIHIGFWWESQRERDRYVEVKGKVVPVLK